MNHNSGSTKNGSFSTRPYTSQAGMPEILRPRIKCILRRAISFSFFVLLLMSSVTVLLLILQLNASPLTLNKQYQNEGIVNILKDSFFYNNFHAVVPGRLYRSATISKADLQQKIKSLNIQTVIDLRLSPHRKKYPDGTTEANLVTGLGRKYFSIPLRSSRIPNQKLLNELLDAFNISNGPILIHCLQGVHRTGVASALWLLYRGHANIQQAEKQLTLPYGYLQISQDIKEFQGKHQTIDDLIWNIERDKNFKVKHLKDWITNNTPLTDKFQKEIDEERQQALN